MNGRGDGLELARRVVGVFIQIWVLMPVGVAIHFIGYREVLSWYGVHAWWAPIPLLLAFFFLYIVGGVLSKGKKRSRVSVNNNRYRSGP